MDRTMGLLEGQMTGTLGREIISTRQEKLAELARIEPKRVLTTLAHHIDEVWLREAYRRTRKDGAVGVDGVTAAQYEADLEANLASLLERFKSGRYRAPAVRRVHIPKPGKAKKTRPIGIPTLEDKVLQRAVLMVLEPIYEQDFLDCSYGFRPGRSAHQALDALWRGLMAMGGGWIIDLDIQSFFDDVDWDHLRRFLDQRVRDGVIRRAIGKWLNAGVMESGEVSHPERGTPQGGVVSPLLSNLYLHEVLDVWFEHEVKPRLRGRAFEVRFADDAALVFEREEDARRVLAVLSKRFAKYGLRLHPEKTRLVDFRSPPRRRAGRLATRAQLRVAGVHSLLGTLQEGALGSTTQDGQGPFHPCATGNRSLVPSASSLAGSGPASGLAPQAPGSLRLLRHHRQWACARPLSLRGPTPVAQVAASPLVAWAHDVGEVCPSYHALSAPPTARCSQCLPSCSDAIVRGAGCPNRARPDLWEPRVSNHPRPPGKCEMPIMPPQIPPNRFG